MKKILIVGSSAKEYALAKKMQNYEVFIAPGNERISDIAKCVDIRENKTDELLKFALENQIDLTIASSEEAIKSDIASVFQANNQLIFAPTAKSAEIAMSRSQTKKFLYKLRIPTPHFAIYDKQQAAIDYLKTAPMPQVIHTDNDSDRLVCTNFVTAKTFVDDMFTKGEKKVILEDFVYGHEFTFYIVTDGYHAIPLTTVANYKFMENDSGGLLTRGVGAYVPDYKISIKNKTLNNIVNSVLEALQRKGNPYLGIIGIDCILEEGKDIVILNFKHFLSDHDAQAVLNTIDDDLFDIFTSCAVGTFEDYQKINISDNSAISCVVSSRAEGKPIKGLNIVESDITPFAISKNKYLEFETIKGFNFVLTQTAKTLSRARHCLYEDLKYINFEGIKYRTDICEQVENF